MNTTEILEALEAERERLGTAIAALQETRYGKPRGKARNMSPAARKRISQAQKKRWAEQRKKK